MIHSKKLLMNDMVTLTVSTTPASATCTLTYNNVQYSTKTLTVPKGTTVSYSVYYSTYGTTSGSITMDKDKTLTCTGTSDTSSTDIAWSAPHNLTQDVSVGGSSFAAFADASYSTRKPWRLFDGDDSTIWESANGTSSRYIGFYNPTPIKLTHFNLIRMYNAYNSDSYAAGPTQAVLQGSNDNVTYTNLYTWSSNKKPRVIDLYADDLAITDYYKYYKFHMTAGGNSGYYIIGECYADGYYQSSTTIYYWNKSIT